MRKAVVVFSGGQDSTTCLGWAKNRFDEVVAISFFYGQKHAVELEQGRRICEALGVERHVVQADFFGSLVDSALTHNGDVNVAHPRLAHLPASYVPNRNAFFLTLAHAFAQKVGADALVAGMCQTDFSGYPDCRRGFIDREEQALNLGSDSHIRIETPLMYLTKAETFALADREGVLKLVIEESHTCYNGNHTKRHPWGFGCGECPACEIRAKGWQEFSREMPVVE